MAGEVVSVGSEATRFKPGDRVAGCFFKGGSPDDFRSEFHRTALGGSIDGVLAELVAFSEEGLVPVPSYLTSIDELADAQQRAMRLRGGGSGAAGQR